MAYDPSTSLHPERANSPALLFVVGAIKAVLTPILLVGAAAYVAHNAQAASGSDPLADTAGWFFWCIVALVPVVLWGMFTGRRK